jgi:2-keto-4-pentenoate hydratase
MNGAVRQTSLDAEAASIAEQFVRARLEGGALKEYPGVVPPDLDAAYRCQESAIKRWPERIGGWKVARIAAAQQSQYPEERLIGPAFRNNIRVARPGAVVDCPVFEDGFAAVEAELVIRVGAEAPADKTDWTIDEASAYVGELCIGVEIASSPLPTLNDLGPGAVISDFGNNWGIVVGGAIEGWRTLHEIVALSFIDDEFVGRGTSSVRHGPLGALAFTLAKCAKRGRPLRAGDVITTGMITGVHDIRIGQQSRHVFEGFGEVSCRAVRALAYPTSREKRA